MSSSSATLASIMNNPPTTAAPNDEKGKKRKRYLCDVCKDKFFKDFDACVKHEETCQGPPCLEKKKTTDASSSPSPTNAVFDSATATAAPVATAATTTRENDLSSAEIKATMGGCKKQQQQQSRKGSRDDDTLVQLGKPSSSTNKESSLTAAPMHPFFQGGKKEATKNKTKKTKTHNTNVVDLTTETTATTTGSSSSIRTTTTTTTKKRGKTSTPRGKTKETNALRAAFFQGQSPQDIQAMQQAQRVVEFQAKRRRQAQLERERRVKRQKQQQQQPQQQEQQQQQPQSSTSLAPQRSSLEYTAFPVPSHIVPASCGDTTPTTVNSADRDNTSNNSLWNQVQAQKCRKALARHFPWNTTRPLALSTKNDLEETHFVWNSTLGINSQCEARLEKPSDWLLQALSALLVPCTLSSSSTTTTRPSESVVMQPSNKASQQESPAAKALQEFIDEWKEIRQESHSRMMERNRKLVGQKTTKATSRPASQKSKRKDYDDDDDWFMDGSDKSDDEDNATTSLFVLTGAVGVGKTSLVYQVAEQAHCGVLEVNTTEARGAAALRKRIQDATQTHAAKWNRKASAIASAFAKQTDSSCASSSQDKKDESCAALMIVLLDEVDLLYPGHGDKGFWNALSDVSKKAKAPIILTANQLPNELQSSAFCFRHEHVHSSIDQCAAHLLTLATQQGFAIRPERREFATRDAARIANLVHGDYRRITMAMEALKAVPRDGVVAPIMNPRIQLLSKPAAEPSHDDFTMLECNVRVTHIHPAIVPADELSLITLTGQGFLDYAEPPGMGTRGGYPVKVKVGRLESPQARILDDTTIVAVCPPILRKGDSEWVESSDLDLRYAPVTISSSRLLGILSTTDASLQHGKLHDGTPWVAPHGTALLKYRLAIGSAPISDENNIEGSDEECELDCGVSKKHNSMGTLAAPVDMRAVLKVLMEGIDAWLSQKHVIAEVDEPDDLEDQNGLEKIESVCRAAAFESDAAFLEDCGLEGLPMLVGGCVPFETKEKSNVLQFHSAQRKESDSWHCGSNSFFVNFSPREVRLFKRMERELRGCDHWYSEAEDLEDENEQPVTNDHPDDDVFLARHVANLLLEIPGCIRSLVKSPVPPVEIDLLFSSRRKHTWEQQVDLLESYTFAYNQRDLKSFFCGLNRRVDLLLDPADYFDSRLVLDYLPLLRSMAVLERAANKFYQEQQDAQVASSLTNRSRSTRSSAKKGREHYFEAAFEYLKALNEPEQVNHVGNSFCRGFLSY